MRVSESKYILDCQCHKISSIIVVPTLVSAIVMFVNIGVDDLVSKGGVRRLMENAIQNCHIFFFWGINP